MSDDDAEESQERIDEAVEAAIAFDFATVEDVKQKLAKECDPGE